MNKNIYTIYDTGAEEFGPIFSANNDVTAQRNFIEIVKNSSFKDEYELYRIGKVEIEVNKKDDFLVSVIKDFELVSINIIDLGETKSNLRINGE